MQIFSVQKGRSLRYSDGSQISKEVDEALNACRVDVAMTSEVVESLAILGRVAWLAESGALTLAQPLASKVRMPSKMGLGGKTSPPHASALRREWSVNSSGSLFHN